MHLREIAVWVLLAVATTTSFACGDDSDDKDDHKHDGATDHDEEDGG